METIGTLQLMNRILQPISNQPYMSILPENFKNKFNINNFDIKRSGTSSRLAELKSLFTTHFKETGH